MGALVQNYQQTRTFDVTIRSDIGSVQLFSDDMEDGICGSMTLSATGYISRYWIRSTPIAPTLAGINKMAKRCRTRL